MIDLKHALNAFQEYRNNYPNTERINLKVEHTKRVMKNSIQLARSLNLSEEDVALAGLIGLLHDIGRFEQAKIYDTFIDSQSINHAMFSSEQLFKNGLIRKFVSDTQYDDIIKKAIENHNKFEIDKDVSGKALFMSKLIRDADKCDIYVQVLESDPVLVFDGNYDKTDKVSDKVLSDFMQHKCIETKDMNCKADDYVRKVALIYGLYFPDSLKVIDEQNLIGRLTDHFINSFEFSNPNTVDTIRNVNKHANKYISEQLREKDIER